MALDWSRRVMAPLQRTENGLQSTMPTLLGGPVSELGGGQSSPRVSVAWASGSLSWALLHRATCWSAVRHAALMPRICDEALLGARPS